MSDNGHVTYEEINFDSLEPIEIPVNAGGHKYILREASGAAAVAYKNAAAKTAIMADGKIVGVDKVGEIEPMMVALCLCETDQVTGRVRLDRQNNPITVHNAQIRSWKASVVKKLFDKIKEISPDLDDKPTKEGFKRQIDLLVRQMLSSNEEDRMEYSTLLQEANHKILESIKSYSQDNEDSTREGGDITGSRSTSSQERQEGSEGSVKN